MTKPREAFKRDASRRDGLFIHCRDCERAQRRQRYAADPEAILEPQRQYRKDHPDQARERDRRRWEKRRDKQSAYKKRVRAELRLRVFGHYGMQCACCGSTKQLSIDHVNGDGAAHRREIFGSNRMPSESMYRWIIANGFPADLQTLCKPCNHSKRTFKSCRLDHTLKAASA
jgi:hypothetical protein